MARKNKYNAKLAKTIFELFSSDSYTVAEVCKIVKIGRSTFYSMRSKYPEFAQGLKQAEEIRKELYIIEAKKSLLKKIQGYTVKEQHVTTVGTGRYDDNGKEIAKVKEQRTVEKHIQADTSAVIFTLCNCDPNNWKNRQRTEITGKEERPIFDGISDEELDAKIAELEKYIKL